MERDRITLAKYEKRYDTFIKSEEVQNYLTTRDIKNKFTKALQEGTVFDFGLYEIDLMVKHFGAAGEQVVLMNMTLTRLIAQECLQSAN